MDRAPLTALLAAAGSWITRRINPHSQTHKGERLAKRNGSTAVRKAYPYMPEWWNGRHDCLKSSCESMWVRVPPQAPLKIKRKEELSMNATILALENRINILRNRDAVGNAKIIRKLERRLRAMKPVEI